MTATYMRLRRAIESASRDQLLHDLSMHVGQAEIAAGVAVCKTFVVEAEEFQQRGVQVVDVDWFLDRFETEFVGRSVDVAAAHTAASEPHGEAVMVVVSAVDLAGVGPFLREFNGRRATELAAPNDECFFQQTALLEVGQQRADRLIALLGETTVIDFDVVVVVPRLTFAVPDLDEADASFDQAPSNQNLSCLRAGAVCVEDVLRLAADVERLFGIALHPE